MFSIVLLLVLLGQMIFGYGQVCPRPLDRAEPHSQSEGPSLRKRVSEREREREKKKKTRKKNKSERGH